MRITKVSIIHSRHSDDLEKDINKKLLELAENNTHGANIEIKDIKYQSTSGIMGGLWEKLICEASAMIIYEMNIDK